MSALPDMNRRHPANGDLAMSAFTMTDAAEELFLTINNESIGYKNRLRLGHAAAFGTPVEQERAAESFAIISASGAASYRLRFGAEPDATAYTAVDILLCALRLTEAYADYARERKAETAGKES
jgi:hypothetical protein